MDFVRLRAALAALVAGCALFVATAAALAAPSSCEFTVASVPVTGGNVVYGRVGDGHPVVLLHGLFADKSQWQGLACLLSASGYSAIAPDLPGFGQSTGFPVAAYRIANQATLIGEFADALGLREFALAGNSMGGAIAALYARGHPQRVRSLAFIGSTLGFTDWSEDVRNAIYSGTNPFIPLDGKELDLELALLFVKPPVLPDAIRDALVREYNDRLRHYMAVWNIVSLDLNVLRDVRRFAVPTLAIWGTEDRVFSIGDAKPLRSRLPAHDFVALRGAGHLPQVEVPDRIASIYLPFLSRPPRPHPLPALDAPVERPPPRQGTAGR